MSATVGVVVVVVVLVVALVATGVVRNAWDKTVTKSPTYDGPCADPKCVCREAPCPKCKKPMWAHDEFADGTMCPPPATVLPSHPWPRPQRNPQYEREEDDVA